MPKTIWDSTLGTCSRKTTLTAEDQTKWVKQKTSTKISSKTKNASFALSRASFLAWQRLAIPSTRHVQNSRLPSLTREPSTTGPTRRQRAKYATQGGLSDEYVEIGVDVAPLHDEALTAINEMSKYTHVRPDTLVENQDAIDAFVTSAMSALLGLLSSFERCRYTDIDALSEEIDNEAVNALITDTIESIDEIATHHSIEGVFVNRMRIFSLTHDTIYFEVEGTLSVGLQWGSNSDVRNDMGAELDESFPFEVTMKSPIDDAAAFYDVSYFVEMAEWYGDDDRE
jgi:hypothetical protein